MTFEYILTSEEYDQVKSHCLVSFNCKRCGELSTHYVDSRRRKAGRRLLCTKCSAYVTNMERYGVDNPAKSSKVKEKTRQTNLERYGVEWTGQDPAIREKQNKTNLERYGSECVFGNKEIQEKAKNTLIDRYGVSSYLKAEGFQDKADKTNIERYGDKIPQRTEKVREKTEKTNIERYGVVAPILNEEIHSKIISYFKETYGVDNPMKLASTKEKVRKTNLERYGVEWIVQSKYFLEVTNRKSYKDYEIKSSRYLYDSLSFDSSWELAYYIFMRDRGEDIERKPSPIPYMYENFEHKYYPDFKVNGQIVEIKGDHFFNKDGELVNPYNSKENGKYSAKYQCMKENKVIILRGTDIIPYIEYVCNEYGKDYMNSYRKSPHKKVSEDK